MKPTRFLLFAIFVGFGCSGTRTVTMNSMRPAEITFPSYINSLLIVDRSKFEKDAINILEGVLTGELPGEDKAGAQEMMNAFQTQLSYSPRFSTRIAEQRLDGNSITAAFPDQIPWVKVKQMCDQYSSEALVALEIFDSDFIITDGVRKVKKTVGEGENKREVEVDEFYAEGVGNLSIGIRLYDPAARSIVDQQLIRETNTWTAAGASKKEALAALISKGDATRYLGRQAGRDYAFKIAPMPIRISRTFFGKSKKAPELERGSRLADVGKWQEAADMWESGISGSADKEAGKLAYNVAIAYEVLGEMDLAQEWAQKAYVTYGNKDARQYSSTLRNRVIQEQRAQDQMN
ncbi:MAG: DUF6340 family protein [Fulvivirga sp.]|uniref:DUF6340 family protein n=1 Tax=Fulvivirga sp. TaxID=1931237 RepID=UPI0032EE5469